MVEDLDEIELEENDQDDFEQNFKQLEEDKTEKKTRTSFTDK